MINQIIRSSLLLILATISCCFVVNCQFLPQSHLGRLMQSITSPLVLNGGESEASYPESSSYYSPGSSSSSDDSDRARQHQPQTHAQARPYHATSSSYNRQKQHYNQQQALQQAPSQQRGIPQHYYGHNNNQYDEDRDQGNAQPSNNKGNTQEYQMGAYLGPTIDDKEINGAFNSNDDKDDDDGPSNYDAGSSPSMTGGAGSERQRETSYNNNDGYGSQMGLERQPTNSANYGRLNQYDDADEDDSERGPGPSRQRNYYKGGLNQAASQYQQQDSYVNNNANSGMMTAANGYAPYGSFFVGGDPNGFQVFNGDGSYPGNNYYQQQQPQRGGRNYQQQASMSNQGYQDQNSGRQSNGDNDDHDMDDNED